MNTHHMIETNPEVMLPDEMVLELAVADNRLLITEDKDFGEWVFAGLGRMTLDRRYAGSCCVLRPVRA